MVNVVAGLIEKDNKFLIAKRSTGLPSVFGKWEFPGGKVEGNETDIEALKREIKEELNIEIDAEGYIADTFYNYKDKDMHLKLFKCKYKSGEIVLSEHSEYVWETIEKIKDYDLVVNDIDLLNKVIKGGSYE